MLKQFLRSKNILNYHSLFSKNIYLGNKTIQNREEFNRLINNQYSSFLTFPSEVIINTWMQVV